MYIKVTVYTDRKTDTIRKVGEQRFEILTRQPAERNLANERVRELVADMYGVTTANVRIVSGHHHPKKLIEVIQEE